MVRIAGKGHQKVAAQSGSVPHQRATHALNIVVAGSLGALHLLNPTFAAQHIWQGAHGAGLPLQMVGAWWAAVALLSALGMRSPFKYR